MVRVSLENLYFLYQYYNMGLDAGFLPLPGTRENLRDNIYKAKQYNFEDTFWWFLRTTK